MKYITITKVAELKEVSRATVYKWIEQDKIDSKEFGNKVKVANNKKLANIEVKKDIQHTLKLYGQRIKDLEQLVASQNKTISTLEAAVKTLAASGHVGSGGPKKGQKRNVTNEKQHATPKKRHVSKSKRNVTKSASGLSNKKRLGILKLVEKALNEGMSKKDLDPATRGSGVRRILENSEGTTDKKLLELEKNANKYLSGR